ncbi:SMP-30/gluconolaconase/LRE-like region family protein, partial [Paraburkholderia sp. WC7.3b]|nr:SMP-30/gluconolaconase/LRE-like region family protein [Paraburkholderia podalyriae]
IGDEGPDMNVKSYDVSAAPVLTGTFGVTGGYLDATTGTKGQVGPKRFTRVTGLGRDAAGNLYVLNNPWGGTWDLGRNGGTDL